MSRLLVALPVLSLTVAMAVGVPATPADGMSRTGPADHSLPWEVEEIPEFESPDAALRAWLNRDPDYGYDVDHYDLALSIDFASETIDCVATLSVTVNEPGLATIPVDLNNALTVTTVTIDGAPRPFTQLDEQVIVELGAPPPVGTPLVAALAYNGTPVPIGTYTSFQFRQHDGVPLAYTMSAPYSTEEYTLIPISHYWRACKEDLTDKSTYSCALTVPDTMTACSNGLETSVVDNGNGTKTFFWAHDHAIAPYLINLAVTNYERIEDEYSGTGGIIPIIHFAWPEDVDDAAIDWSVTVPAMEVLVPLFGEYPFLGDKYGMCEVGAGPALENQTMTSMSASYVNGTGAANKLVVHELAHQWWGDCVTVADWDHVWLNEGFAMYAVALWLESEGGPDALRNYMHQLAWERFDCPVVPPPRIWHSVVYNKGAWVLHMLRHILNSDSAFFQMLRDYRAAHEYGNVVTADFVEAAEVTYGEDLGWLFDPWLYEAGRPEYEFHWRSGEALPGIPTVQLTIRQVQPLEMPTYRMPMDVRVTTAAGEENFIIWNEARLETHSLPVGAEPVAVALDPDGWILADVFDVRRSIVAGPGPSPDNPPIVRLFTAEVGTPLTCQFHAYGPQHYGVNVCRSDVNHDGVDEVLTGPGPGAVFGPHVRGFHGDGTPVEGLSFLAYGTNKYGVNVAAGNLDENIYQEIITGAGPGAVFGPHVRAFHYRFAQGVEPVQGVSFFAYGTLRWGVNVACGDVDGDGFDEIVTGPGPGAVFGPHVRGWNVDGGTAASMPGINFLAYGTNRFGVNVGCGDIDGDGIDEIVTGPGPGNMFGTHIRGWDFDGSSIVQLPGFSFFAWSHSGETQVRNGANVFSGFDLNFDGKDELIVGCGPDPNTGTPIKVYLYDGSRVTEWLSLSAFDDMELTHGTNVAAGRF